MAQKANGLSPEELQTQQVQIMSQLNDVVSSISAISGESKESIGLELLNTMLLAAKAKLAAANAGRNMREGSGLIWGGLRTIAGFRTQEGI